MFRRLLACLALLTGLTAAGAPAQAEVAHAMAAHVEARASGVTAARSQTAVAIARRPVGRIYGVSRWVRPLAGQSRTAPTVQLGSDRARE